MTTASFSQSEPAWRRCISADRLQAIPAGLVASLDAGECVLIASRVAGHAAGATELVVDDVYDAAEQLYAQSGIDFRPMLPPRKQMIHLLHEASLCGR